MKINLSPFSLLAVVSLNLCVISTGLKAQTWINPNSGLDNNVWGMVTDTVNNLSYIAGPFVNAGGNTVNYITQYDGTNFSAMNIGMNNFTSALAIYNNQLYCGGNFTVAGSNACNHIAMWDGTDWQAVGTGMNSDIYYLHAAGGNLYAGGIFTMADGNPSSRIAMWDGTSWSALGSGVSGGGFTQVLSIQEYNGEIYVAGQFTDAGGVSVNNIAKWDGTSWSDVAGGATGAGLFVIDLLVYNNELYAAGSFTSMGGVAANGIAKWNGTTWSAVGTGISGGGGYGAVLSMYNGELYVGGNFTSVDGVSANYIARYNGISWNNLGPGCDQEIGALEVLNGELLVGGAFFNAGGIGAQRLAKWSSGCTAVTVATGTGVSCLGACDGSASLYTTGAAPFTYLWSNGDTTSSVSSLCAGTYTITVTDNNGCTATDLVTIVENPLPVLSVSSANPVCPAQCNGSAYVTATGFSPFTYSWSTIPVQNTDTATALCAGTYYITVTDSAGCASVDSVFLTDPAAATLSFITNSTLCPGNCNGDATVNTTSLNSPYTYNWNTSPVQNTQTAINLCAGTWSVTVTDSLGCEVTDSVTVTDSPAFALSFAAVSPTCPGSCDGMAWVITASPYTPFTYFWNTVPVQNTDTATSLCEGYYSVLVIDSAGCFSQDSVFVPDPNISLNVVTSDATCAGGGCDGSATASMPGGIPPFVYQWSTGDTTDSISGLCAGAYMITVTDSLGCSLTGFIFIFAPTFPSIAFSSTTPLCFGDCTGTINSNATGTSSLTYLWSNGFTTDSIANLCEGWYSLTVTDSTGCITNDSLFLPQPSQVDVFVTTVTDVTCNGFCDGFISVTTGGGTPGYTYLWSTGDTNPDLFNVCAGSYTVTATDANGCQDSTIITVNEPAALSLTMIPTNATCQGCNDGSIAVIISGGTPAYVYFWTPPVPNPNQLTAGWYYLCIIDANSCQICDSAYVDEPNGVFEVAGHNLSLFVYPNPFRVSTTLKIPSEFIKSGKINFSLFDLLGNKISTQTFDAAIKNNYLEIKIERRNLASGMYFFRIANTDVQIGSGRFVVE
ncbi:MAG: T9SS type A sorting domain-containing protein [Bacteroidia bacterium]